MIPLDSEPVSARSTSGDAFAEARDEALLSRRWMAVVGDGSCGRWQLWEMAVVGDGKTESGVD